MFIIYYFNKLERLKEILCDKIVMKDNNLLQPEIFLLEDDVISQWLQIKLVEKIGIIANIKFSNISNFIWEFSNIISPKIPKTNPIDQEIIKNIILDILFNINSESCKLILNYFNLCNINKNFIFEFSTLISKVFYLYSIYRHDWINMWKKNKLIKGLSNIQIWQSKLCNELCFYMKKKNKNLWNYYTLYKDILKKNKSINQVYNIPKRIFIISDFLPIIYNKIFYVFSKYTTVYMLLKTNSYKSCKKLSYCIKKSIKKIDKKNIIIFKYFDLYPKYRLKMKISKTNKINKNDINKVIEKLNFTDFNILNSIQNDIIEDKYSEKGVFSKGEKYLKYFKEKDDSLRICICSNPNIEIRMLHSNILYILKKNKNLSFKDITVITPNIELYIDYIKYIFDSTKSNNYIPFNISDIKFSIKFPILKYILKIINLPNIKLSVKKVFNFLEIPILAKKFEIEYKEILFLKEITYNSGIELNEIENTISNNFELNTWKSGIHRILLGYAINENNKLWGKTIPYDKYSDDTLDSINKFLIFLEKLFYWKKLLYKINTQKDWLFNINKLIEEFFFVEEKEKHVINLLFEKIKKIFQLNQIENKKFIYADFVYQELNYWINNKKYVRIFFNNKVNFCTFQKNKLITNKIIYMLGMNANFDNQEKESINLINEKKRDTDYYSFRNNRYIFLEGVLSARNILYISYSNYDLKNNRINKSYIIQEFEEYVCRNFDLFKDRIYISNLNIYQSSFLLKKIILNDCPNLKNKLSIPIKKKNKIDSSYNNLPKNKIKTLNLYNLIRFYYHPIKSFFNIRLNIYFPNLNYKMQRYESYVENNFKDYEVRNLILQNLIKKDSLNYLFHKLNKFKILPYGNLGKIYWEKNIEEIQTLFKKVEKCLKIKSYSIKFKINLDAYEVCGELKDIRVGIIRYYPRIISIKDKISLWIEHLFYCLLVKNPSYSKIIGINNTYYFLPIDKTQAKKNLISLVLGFDQGMQAPLHFFIKSSTSWITSCFNKKINEINWTEYAQTKAKKNFLNIWYGGKKEKTFFTGEKEDIYIRRIINKTELKEKVIKKNIFFSCKYLLPILKCINEISY